MTRSPLATAVRIVLLSVGLFALVAAGRGHAAPIEVEPLTYKAPLRVSVDPASVRALHVGVRVPLRLIVRNVTGPATGRPAVAVVLRGLAWTGDRLDERSWLRHVFGDIRPQNDGTLAFEATSGRLSELRVESALLFPGDQVTIDMPFTPQRNGRQKVDVVYGVVGGVECWSSDIWLVQPGEGRFVFWPRATGDEIARKGLVGGPAVVRQSMRPDGRPLPLSHETWSVDLQVKPDPRGLATGGMSAERALQAVGWADWVRAHPQRKIWCYWRPVLHAWVFVRDDGTSIALHLERGQGRVEKMPRLAAGVPERFGAAPDMATDMLLRPDVFGDLIAVRQSMQQGIVYDPGLTRVPAALLWTLLRRAVDRDVTLSMVTYDANGLGNEQTVSAGVRLDRAGRWLPLGDPSH